MSDVQPHLQLLLLNKPPSKILEASKGTLIICSNNLVSYQDRPLVSERGFD